MKRMKFLTIGIISILLCSLVVLDNVYADQTGGGRRGKPPVAPEPVSYALLLAGGATLAALRRWKTKRDSRELHNKKS
jgi:hypothetical protein